MKVIKKRDDIDTAVTYLIAFLLFSCVSFLLKKLNQSFTILHFNYTCKKKGKTPNFGLLKLLI
jgi:hypothetical protein